MAVEPGSRQKPIHVTGPADMAAVAQRIQQPSPSAARAGNYAMGHVKIGGLDVSIETPMGGVRQGIGPDGIGWAVRMPVDYGYIKNTEGADGDHVDVYIGQHAHAVDNYPVWVVDQIDADTKKFDEHKCMIGFADVNAAKHAYEHAFSDNRAHERVGAITIMPWEKFVQWLGEGDCKKPLSYRFSEKSASLTIGYSGSVQPCSCGGSCVSCAPRGVTMDPNIPATGSVQQAGQFSAIFEKFLGELPAQSRSEFLASAAATSATAIAKANEMLTSHREPNAHWQDQWSGAPDDAIRMGAHHGPGSAAPAGVVPVGPRQAASGDGAISMEAMYSLHTRQTGVEEATNRLGREIAKSRGDMQLIGSALQEFGKAMSVHEGRLAAQEALAKSTALTPTIDVGAEIAKALSAAIPSILQKAVGVLCKGMEQEEEDKEEHEEIEKAIREAFAVSKSEIEDEMHEEGAKEKESEKEKEAAKSRIAAQRLLRIATRALRKAKEHEDETHEKEEREEVGKAIRVLQKARIYLELSKAISGAEPGKSTLDIAKGIKAASSHECMAVMQTKWPEGKTTEAAKSADPAALAAIRAELETVKARGAELEKALSGQGMLLASTTDLVNVVARQPAGSDLPPVFGILGGKSVLAKAKENPAGLTGVKGQIENLAATNVISMDERDRSMDLLQRAEMGVPAEVIASMATQLPPQVQALVGVSQHAA